MTESIDILKKRKKRSTNQKKSVNLSFASDLKIDKSAIEINTLKTKIERLNFLALNYDPSLETLPNEIKSLFKEFNIDLEENLDNPYHIQNKILLLLDEATSSLKKLFQ